MPRYDYECKKCHNTFEVKQSFSDEAVATCPDCQEIASRVIHAVPIVFKGSGFYVNEYGKGSGFTGKRPDSDGDTDSSSGEIETRNSDPKSEKSDSDSSKESKSEQTIPRPDKLKQSNPKTEKASKS